MFKIQRGHILFLSIAAIIVIAAKLWHINATTEDLRFLLSPTAVGVESFMGTIFIWQPETGYINQVLNVAIDKGCSGMNFWIIAFTVGCLSLLTRKLTQPKLLIMLPVMATLAFVLTIFANTSRIVIAIKAIPLEGNSSFLNSSNLHQLIGIAVYLTVLILFYQLLLRTSRQKKLDHEKVA